VDRPPYKLTFQYMELLTLALPFATTAVMFALKKVAQFRMFDNGAEARPWLRALLIITSVIGTGALSFLNGTDVNPDSISYLIQLLLQTGANAYLSHSFYNQISR
jgi:hypothetical protein